MNEKIKKIMEEMSENPEYLGKLNELNEKYPDRKENIPEFISLVNKYGYEITEEDIESLADVPEEDLDKIAGGRIKDDECDCFCFVGGGGTGDEWQKTCACVAGGGGQFTDAGLEKYWTPGVQKAWMCCIGVGCGAHFDPKK